MNAGFVDTNIVLYGLSDDVTKCRQALVILADHQVLSLQVLSETANVMRHKLRFDIPGAASLAARKPFASLGIINPAVRCD